MHCRLFDFFETNSILENNQFGFRPKHSTYMALLKMTDKITAEMDNKYYSLGIFLDLSKAFDTIDHQILLDKLHRYGIRGIAYEWIKSCLSNRKQCVSVNGELSDLMPIYCGVPQGSILGKLLFIIYINDISKISKMLDFILFADDTNIFVKDKSLSSLNCAVNLELKKISRWFKLNKLSLYLKKINYILFTKKSRINPNELDIKIDSVVVQRATQTEFLGFVINERLTWNDHIQVVKHKVSKGLGILTKIRHFITNSILINLYYTLIYPHFEYCNIVWALCGTSSTYIAKLFLLQKRAVRIITKSPWKAHTAPIFRRLGILTIFDINKLQTACFMYRVKCRLMPSYFDKMFLPNSSIHQYNTRQIDDLHVFYSRTTIRQNSIAIYGTKIWNNLDPKLKQLTTPNQFKYHYKNFLISNCSV